MIKDANENKKIFLELFLDGWCKTLNHKPSFITMLYNQKKYTYRAKIGKRKRVEWKTPALVRFVYFYYFV